MKDPAKRKAYNAAYYAAHREGLREPNKARSAAHHASHLAEHIAYGSAYYIAHREEMRAYEKARHAAHPEVGNARSAVYRLTHSEEARAYDVAYRAANPDKGREHHRKAKAIRRGARLCDHPGCLTIGPAQLAWQVNPHVCYICGTPVWQGVNLHMDHVVPISRGGVHCADNLRPACAFCNLSKHNRVA